MHAMPEQSTLLDQLMEAPQDDAEAREKLRIATNALKMLITANHIKPEKVYAAIDICMDIENRQKQP